MDKKKLAEVRQMVGDEVEKAWRRAMVADSFDEMEEIVVQMGQAVEAAVLSGMAEQRETARPPRCPECGRRMRRKDKVPRQMKTSKGEVGIDRDRWVCDECETSLFPPGRPTRDKSLLPDDETA
jgi:uncharacterized protein with PIN domain